jgi:hypothetical protein
MAQVDIVKDMPQKQLAPIDPDVKIPDSVKAQAERANSYYKKPAAEPAKEVAISAATEAQPAENPPLNQPVTQIGEPAAEPAKRKPGRPRNPVPAPEPVPEPVAEPVEDTRAPPVVAVQETRPQPDNWEHRYHSMKGRHDALLQGQGSMQEQMSQMGDELMRMQQILQQRGSQQTTQQPVTKKLLTDEDVKTYGPELIDLARRAGLEAVGPELEASQTEIRQLKQSISRSAQAGVQQTLDRDVPTWREINLDPRFKQWLRLPNIYSGRIRHQMLSDAYQAANAPLVAQLFRDFIDDEEATGNYEPAPTAEQPPKPAPRKAAVPLETLAAPGRAKPAGGEPTAPADKPRFSRTQIQRFYSTVRQGGFLGREVEKDRQEQEIFLAQREGRVTG